jgi:acetolactate synthase-1/2/3 large subunit
MIRIEPPIRPAAERTIASYAVDLAVALGSSAGFCVTGGMAMHLNRAAATHPKLRMVYTQHEQAAVVAAEGYAKASDFVRPGLAFVTAGPGATNAITGLVSAYGDSVPLIVLAGQVKTPDIDPFGVRTHGIQEVKSRELISPCVKRFARLSFDGFQELLEDSYAEALAGRPGPVYVEVPLDVQGRPFAYELADIESAARRIRERARPTPNPTEVAALTAALAALRAARRPLLYVGNGVRIAGITDAVRAFAEHEHIPCVFSWLSFDIISADHPLHLGCPGGLAPISANCALGSADLILFLGARLDLGTTAFQRADFGAQARRIFVDVDTAELGKFGGLRGVETLAADLRALPAAIEALAPTAGAASRAEWAGLCATQKREALAEERRRLSIDCLNVYAIAERLSAWSAGKVFVPASSGYAEETFSRFFAPGEGARFFNGAALGAMGMGLPMALGAAFGSKRQVIALEADGGIMLNLQELATLKQNAPKGFVLFILNNGGYESIRSSQVRFFGEAKGADPSSGLYLPDFARVAAASSWNTGVSRIYRRWRRCCPSSHPSARPS